MARICEIKVTVNGGRVDVSLKDGISPMNGLAGHVTWRSRRVTSSERTAAEREISQAYSHDPIVPRSAMERRVMTAAALAYRESENAKER